ncbi:MAG: hypothetical protein RIB80_05410 [Rhodospirillales bacterium]
MRRCAATAGLLAVLLVGAVQARPVDWETHRLIRYWYGTIWSQDFSPATDADLAVDLTCDGDPDRVFAWRDGVNPEGEYFHVALVSKPGGGAGWERLPDVASGLLPLRINVGTGEQYALCDNRQEPYGSGYKTTVAPVPDAARSRFGLPETCRAWLRIDDGMCDALWVGYDPAKGTFVLDRN